MRNPSWFPKGVLSSPKPIQKGQRISPQTEFKKGCVPKNKLPVGSVTIRQQRNDGPRAWIKTAEPNTWVPRAKWVWESSNGEVPKGFVVHHVNEDTIDDRIDNLRLLTRKEHRLLHQTEIQAGKKNGRMERGFAVNHVPIKQVKCTTCGKYVMGKYQKRKSFCDECHRQSKAKIARAYRERLRSRS